MALLHVLAELREASGWTLVVAHVDHGLRPDEAGAEASLVQEAARRLEVPCEQGRVMVQAHAREKGLSIEHAARDLRYGFLGQVARQYRAEKIGVAHTADDQAEEILLRLIRGTGRAGLSGMALCRNNLLIRPFLAIGKKELLAYLAARGIAFCQDSSNRQRICLRNRIRLDLLPWLKEHFNPAVERSLRERAALFQAEEELLANLARTACNSVIQKAKEPDSGLTITLAEFSRQPLALKRRILEAACWDMGCRPSFRQIEQLCHLAGAKEGALLHLAEGLRVSRQGQGLCFCYPQGKKATRGNLGRVTAPQDYCVEIIGPGVYPLAVIGNVVRLEIMEATSAMGLGQGPETICLDADRLSFPLVVRPYRPGDRFLPLGAPGRKKVGDFFTDRKIPVAERWKVPVLTDCQGIVALLGLRPDQRCAVTPQTGRVLAVTLSPAAPLFGPAGKSGPK